MTAATILGSRRAGEVPLDLMPFIVAGPAGRRTAKGLAFDKAGEGFVFYGPYISLPPGRYRVRIDMAAPARLPWHPPVPPLPVVLDVVDGPTLLAETCVVPARRTTAQLDVLHDGRGTPSFEVRLRKTAGSVGYVRRLVLEALADPPG